jgi:hypothetical protein
VIERKDRITHGSNFHGAPFWIEMAAQPNSSNGAIFIRKENIVLARTEFWSVNIPTSPQDAV